MTPRLPIDKNDDRAVGLNWPRIAGMSFVIAVHAAALMLLLAPVTPPGAEKQDEDVTRVTFIEPPPPPPPPPKEPPKEIKLTPTPTPPTPTPTPPPPEPPVVLDNPTPMSTQAAPPAPPAPTPPAAVPSRNTSDLRASICSAPPTTPLQVAVTKAQEEGTTIITLTFTADGAVTGASVGQSSHNRDLDRAALAWAKGVKLCPGAAGTGNLPIVMKL
jgi:protein TonB